MAHDFIPREPGSLMAVRWSAAILSVFVLFTVTGCVVIGLPYGISVKSGEIPGTWRDKCGEVMVLRAGGAGTETGFPLSAGSGKATPTGGDVVWELDSPDDPHLTVTVTAANEFWYMQFTRSAGHLRVVNDAGGRTCTFTRD